MEELDQIKRLLWEEWDPIGVRGDDWPDDEYDSYAPRVLAMLNAESSEAQIADFLLSVETEWMGLSSPSGRVQEVARKALQIHEDCK